MESNIKLCAIYSWCSDVGDIDDVDDMEDFDGDKDIQCWTTIILQNPDRWGRQKEGFAEATTRPTQRAQCVCKGCKLKRSTCGVCTDGDFLTETQPSPSLTFQMRCKSGLPKSSTTVPSYSYSNEYVNQVV